MKAMLIHRPERDGHEVYLYCEEQGGRRVYYFNDYGSLYLDGGDPYPDHEAIPSTAFLSGDQYEVLRRAMIGDVLAHDDATRDARNVRDRLLTLVEDVIRRG